MIFLKVDALAAAARIFSLAIRDLCTRYSVDLAALSGDAWMDWNDPGEAAADPLVTIGKATVKLFCPVEPEG